MIDAAHRVTMPLFLIQAANDYSIRPDPRARRRSRRHGQDRPVADLRRFRHHQGRRPFPLPRRAGPLVAGGPRFPRSLALDGGRDDRSLRGAFLEDLTWLEAKAWFDRDPVIVIGIGAIAKEHGHHLPLNTDFRLARALVEGVGRALPVLLAPILAFGYYPAFRQLSRQPASRGRDLHRAAARHSRRLHPPGRAAPCDRQHRRLHRGPVRIAVRTAGGPWHPCRRRRYRDAGPQGRCALRAEARRPCRRA